MTENEKLNYLMKRGINAKQGLKYADDSPEFYQQLIEIFLDEYEEKKKLILEEAQNPGKDYTVLVHALKNNARSLGAEKLADLAYEHEKASRSENTEFVKEHVEELVATWERTVHIFKEI